MLLHRSPLRTFGLGVTLGVAILGTACSTVGGPQQASPDPAGLPDYRVGQSFTFSDRRTRRVAAVEGRAVRWSGGSNGSYLAAPNFIVPILRREGSSRVVSHRAFGRPDDLWPLQVGKSVRFRVARTIAPKTGGKPKETSYAWACRVSGRNKVTVPAGTFDTYRIECTRTSGSRQTADRRVTWYYAPKIGHYVRRDKERLSSHATSTIELVSIKGRSSRAASRTAIAQAPAKAAGNSRKPAPRAAAPSTSGQAAKTAARHYAVHLASYRSAAGAERGWAALKAHFPALLADKRLELESADLGESGVYQRVLAAPFGSRAAAASLCSRIKAKAAQQFCVVTQG